MKGFSPLSSAKEFNYFYKNSKTIHTKYFVLFYIKDNKKRFSVVASKKIGKAIKRNFAKRRLRALFIKEADKLNDSYILVAKKDILDAKFSHLSYTFKKALKRIL